MTKEMSLEATAEDRQRFCSRDVLWQIVPDTRGSVLKCVLKRGIPTDLHIYNLDAVPPVHVVWNHVDTDKLTTANGGTFTSSSASLSNQSR